jgi:hypothetical protein
MATLKSITAYEGRFILEYSRGADGKPASCFVIENPPEDPLPAGNSLNEAKRVIDGLGGRSALWPLAPEELGAGAMSEESRPAALQCSVPPSGSFPHAKVCSPHTISVVDDSILDALRDRVSQDHGSVRRIARFLSVHSGVILEWLAGTRKPRQATLERIAAYLKGPVIRA